MTKKAHTVCGHCKISKATLELSSNALLIRRSSNQIFIMCMSQVLHSVKTRRLWKYWLNNPSFDQVVLLQDNTAPAVLLKGRCCRLLLQSGAAGLCAVSNCLAQHISLRSNRHCTYKSISSTNSISSMATASHAVYEGSRAALQPWTRS